MSQTSLATLQPFYISDVFVTKREGQSSALPALVQKMLAFFDGQRTLEQVCEEVQISVSKGQAIVRKLTDLEILCPDQSSSTVTSVSGSAAGTPMACSGTPEPSSSGFSAMEEEFFAAELAPIDEADLEQTFRERLGRFFFSFLGLTGARTSLAR